MPSSIIDLLRSPLTLLRKQPAPAPKAPRRPQPKFAAETGEALQLELFSGDASNVSTPAPLPVDGPAGPAGIAGRVNPAALGPTAFAALPGLAASPEFATRPAVPAPSQAQAPAPGERSPAVPGQRRLLLGQHQLCYRLRRSKRRTIGFMIDDDGLRITAPKWVNIGEIESAIREKQRWILTKLHEHRERAERRITPQMQWRDGARMPYLGSELTLRIRPEASDGIVFDADNATLTVCLPAGAAEDRLKDRVQAWLQAQAKALFAARLPLYAEKLDVSYRAFALSSATTQWGSCTADGKIRLNWRLVHFALPLVDYVIAHELSHLREMNHGPRFWATVQSVFPEFETARKALRNHAPESLPAF